MKWKLSVQPVVKQGQTWKTKENLRVPVDVFYGWWRFWSRDSEEEKEHLNPGLHCRSPYL